MRLGGFVMTYHRPAALGETLARLLGQSRPPERLLVLDNGGSEESRQVVGEMGDPRLLYRDLGDNLGPAGAAAAGLAWGAGEGFDWTYWGDDDDPPQSVDTLERLLDLARRCRHEPLAGVAAVGARWSWARGELVRLRDDELTGPVAVEAIGGNAQLLVSHRAVATALPRPELFWALEEIEYCLRLRRAGLVLRVDGDLMCEYRQRAGRIGLDLRRRWLPGLERHQLWRVYYKARNYVHLMRRTFDRPDLARREVVKGVARAAAGFARGLGYGGALARMQLGGLIDGYRDRLGRTVEPSAASVPRPVLSSGRTRRPIP